ncbi:P-loop containing nucleoside triphosphate hydrolase protein [Lophium mytilinum]|uniref:dTMP kinase n=1 Tax=Lophium mytilinum TaxID=390894 RepID=A0A6A6QXY3_9PEZI|nr:P-loop containing nucleoside triphosphate hydrolase protein [Lophium mytilinum]
MINNYLTNQSEQEDHVIHLLFSANRWEAAASIQADISAGTTVVIDRYYYSGCVYSAAKDNPKLDLAWARHPEEGLPRPDVCVFLDISVEEAAKRGGYGGEKYEVQEMQDRVRELFGVLRDSAEKDDFVSIDGGGSFEDVQKTVREAVERAMKKVDGESLPLRFVQPW